MKSLRARRCSFTCWLRVVFTALVVTAILAGIRVSRAEAQEPAKKYAEEMSEFQVPELTGPVVDEAGILDPDLIRFLSRGIRNLKASGGSQINVLTVSTLGRDSIEQASIKVTDKWKLGGEKSDNGILLLIAPSERKVRIEVGQGLEGSLTDAYSNRIIQDTILPAFRSGNYDQGVLSGVIEIIKKTDPNANVEELFKGGQTRTKAKSSGRWLFYLIGLIILISLFSGGGGGRRRRGSFSPWGAGALGYGLGSLGGGGGGWGGGSSGGGGWGGGGGGFSGGGASGGW